MFNELYLLHALCALGLTTSNRNRTSSSSVKNSNPFDVQSTTQPILRDLAARLQTHSKKSSTNEQVRETLRELTHIRNINNTRKDQNEFNGTLSFKGGSLMPGGTPWNQFIPDTDEPPPPVSLLI